MTHGDDQTQFRPIAPSNSGRGGETQGNRTNSLPIDSSSQQTFGEPIGTGGLLGGRYLLGRELGSGGMGIVYFAKDQEVKGELFAIKVLKPEIREYQASLELMREEVRKTRALAHPNIVGAYSLNLDGATAYILMEYLEGKTLTALIDDDFGRGMPFLRAWPLIQDICAALAYAHDHSVIHCDIKPSNVFVTTAGKAKLLDFGIAQAARGGAGRFNTASLGALTIAYASCEMLQERPPEQRDDVYSLACVIYEMLSGNHPFDTPSALEAQRDKMRVAPIASLTRSQNSALARALAFEREKRTPSVEALLAGLEPTRHQSTAVVLIGMVSIVAAAGVAWWIWGDSKREAPTAPVVAATSVSTPPVVTPPAALPLPTPEVHPVSHSAPPPNPCDEPLSPAALDRAVNSGVDSSAKAALYSADSPEARDALAQMLGSVDCVTALRAAGIVSADSKRFLQQAATMLGTDSNDPAKRR